MPTLAKVYKNKSLEVEDHTVKGSYTDEIPYGHITHTDKGTQKSFCKLLFMWASVTSAFFSGLLLVNNYYPITHHSTYRRSQYHTIPTEVWPLSSYDLPDPLQATNRF